MGARVAVAGASGYAGGELLRLLAGHPDLEIGPLTAGSNAGAPVTSVHPNLVGLADRTFGAADPAVLAGADLVFMAMPHAEAAALAAELPAAVKIVDLGAGFRLADPASWARYYGGEHAGTWTYGLPELPGARERIRASARVAAPGCYATASILALAPLLASGLAEPADIVIVAASGTSGAGRAPAPNLMGSEVMGAVSAYKAGGVHRHTPEIEQALQGVLVPGGAGARVTISFTPTLAPMPRGILATATARLTGDAAAAAGETAAAPRCCARPSPQRTRGSGSCTCCPRATGPARARPPGRTRPSCRPRPIPTPAGPSSSRRSTTSARARPGRRCRTPTSCSACRNRPASPPTESRRDDPARPRHPPPPDPQGHRSAPVSVTAPLGFRAAGVVAGLKASGDRDVAVVINDGPSRAAAATFTSNRVKAAPVLWTQQVVQGERVRAVALNSGGANACTGPSGFQDTHLTAERLAAALGDSAGEMAVCSTGLIGERLPMDALLPAVDACVTQASRGGGLAAADAIRTTDTVVKISFRRAAADPEAGGDGTGYAIGGMAKGAGMIAPGLATMLCVLTTDADLPAAGLDAALRAAVRVTFDRLDTDGCMSTNDTVLLLASGASGIRPDPEEFTALLTDVCADLARQLQLDAEGAGKMIAVEVIGAASEDDAVAAGRAVARSNLLKCAIAGEDPNWGRVVSAVGTTAAQFEPDRLNVAINGIWVCRNGCAGDERSKVDMSPRDVTITVDLSAGPNAATIATTDLTAEYVRENSAYST